MKPTTKLLMLCFLVGLIGAVVACGGGGDEDPPRTGSPEFNGSSSKLYVQNLKKSDAQVYVTFGADSCVTQANIRIDGQTGKCTGAKYAECVFTLAAGQKKQIGLDLCRANLTFRFNSPEACGVTKAELNMNVPDWDDTLNISLVDGFNENVRIDVDTADAGRVTLGPTSGIFGNQEAFGVYPYGCDACTTRYEPNCGIKPGDDSQCKLPHGWADHLKPNVPCQWNHPRPNTATISLLEQ